MYLTKENITILNEVITNINNLDSEEEKTIFLNKSVEDVSLLLGTLKSINKSKLPRERKNRRQPEMMCKKKYDEKEISEIFAQKDDGQIMAEYSMADLKAMYQSIYQKKPLSKYKKQDIVNTIRHRFYTIDRASAFASLAEGRKRQTVYPQGTP